MSEMGQSAVRYTKGTVICVRKLAAGWLDNHFQGTLFFFSGKGKRIKILIVGETRLLVFILIFLFLFYNSLNRGVDPYVLNLHLLL